MMIRRSTRRAQAAAVVFFVGLAIGITAADALAFRMIQNTSVGRFSSGGLVRCDDPGGFVHWTNANIAFALNTANQGAGKEAAVQGGLAAWTNVSGANHNLTYAGTTNAGFSTDGTNTLLWANGNGCSGNCLAITALVLTSGQVITETDVSFNNVASWNTNGSDYDTQAIATHELGHCMGIHHTEVKKPTNRPTMYAYYFGTAGQTLENDDRQALQCSQNRYPGSAPPFAAQVAALSHDGVAPGVSLAARPRLGGAVIRFALREGSDVRLQVFDVAGRLLTTLVNGRREAGEHEVAWDGATSTGAAPSGVYFARVQTPGMQARTTVLLAE
jgi:matrixin/flagellar hook capping protein FlgD